jgi:hypothetical protein
MMVDGFACQAPITDLACRQNRIRPRRRCASFDFEDDVEDDLIKIEAQNSISVLCHLFSDT